MVTKGQARSAEKFMELLRGFGFVTQHTSTGWLAIHKDGHAVTGNAKRIKWESFREMVNGTPVVTVFRGPVEVTWVDTRIREAGL